MRECALARSPYPPSVPFLARFRCPYTIAHLSTTCPFPAPCSYYQGCDASTQCPFSALMTLQSSYQICTDAFDERVAQAVNDDRINFTNDFLVSCRVCLRKLHVVGQQHRVTARLTYPAPRSHTPSLRRAARPWRSLARCAPWHEPPFTDATFFVPHFCSHLGRMVNRLLLAAGLARASAITPPALIRARELSIERQRSGARASLAVPADQL